MGDPDRIRTDRCVSARAEPGIAARLSPCYISLYENRPCEAGRVKQPISDGLQPRKFYRATARLLFGRM